MSTELPAKTHCTAPLYINSKVDGLLPPLVVQNRSDRLITIQRGEKVGTWTAAVLAEPHLVPNKDTSNYFVCIPVVDLERTLASHLPTGNPLRSLLLKWHRCFSLDKYDVGRTGPPYEIKLQTGKPYKCYVPRRSPAAGR